MFGLPTKILLVSTPPQLCTCAAGLDTNDSCLHVAEISIRRLYDSRFLRACLRACLLACLLALLLLRLFPFHVYSGYVQRPAIADSEHTLPARSQAIARWRPPYRSAR